VNASRAGAALALALGAWVLGGGPVRAEGQGAPSAQPRAAGEDEQGYGEGEEDEEEEEEDEGLRQRLTEREDKRRPLRPWRTKLAGRPLTIGGEYEIELGYLRRRVFGEDVEQPDRLLLEQGLELETFYSFGRPLSLFAQFKVAWEEDLLPDTLDDVSGAFVEREEMWLYTEDVAGTNLNLELGRIDFEDDRRWWWDEELDGVRVEYEGEGFDVELALAQEVAPRRSDRDYIEPEHDGVLRFAGEASWDFRENHVLELFLLHQDDHSATEGPGKVVRREREDDSDAQLLWLGARLLGVFELRSRGFLGYWLDTGYVRGRERLVEFQEIAGDRSVVEDTLRREVRGWGLDAGASWILPVAYEPRIFAGYAFGSGDPSPETGSDRSYRQTDLQGNEAGFGGVERFPHYGVALDPELSNLHVLTVGAGLSLFRSSSLDLVYHYYRLVQPADSLRDANLEAELTGRDRDLGHGVDLVLALEEWERVEFELVATAFRAGRAFGAEQGRWSYGGLFAMRIAF
jgi:alginate production protein